jgi:hypothetical protein
MTTRPTKAKIAVARNAIEDAVYTLREIASELDTATTTNDQEAAKPGTFPVDIDAGPGPFGWRLDELDTSSRRLRALLV